MARATHLTIGTADRIRLDAGSADEHDYDEDGRDGIRQEVQVSVTYVLDPGDEDLTAVAAEKAGEVQRAHEAAWNRIGALGPGEGKPCTCRSDRSDFDDDEPDNGLHGAEIPPGPSPSGSPAGAWHRSGASRPSSETGTPAPDVPPDEEHLDEEPLTGPQKILIRSRAGKIGLSAYALESLLYQQFKVWRVERLTKIQAGSLLDALDRDLKERAMKERDPKEQGPKEKNGVHGSPALTGTGRPA